MFKPIQHFVALTLFSILTNKCIPRDYISNRKLLKHFLRFYKLSTFGIHIFTMVFPSIKSIFNNLELRIISCICLPLYRALMFPQVFKVQVNEIVHFAENFSTSRSCCCWLYPKIDANQETTSQTISPSNTS